MSFLQWPSFDYTGHATFFVYTGHCAIMKHYTCAAITLSNALRNSIVVVQEAVLSRFVHCLFEYYTSDRQLMMIIRV